MLRRGLVVLFALIVVLPVTICGSGGTPPATVSGHVGVSAWCKNLTMQLTRSWVGFKNVAFNRTTAFVKYPTSDVTEFERLDYDMRDLKIYALIFPQLHPNATVYGNKVVQCVQINTIMYAGLVATMEMTELYLNGTIPSLPQLQGAQTPPATKHIRYQAIGQEMAQLKVLMRRAISIVGEMHADSNSQNTSA